MSNIIIFQSGFPRSGNSYLNNLLTVAFPGNVTLFNHNEDRLDLVNTVVPIRNPYECIPSLSVFSEGQDLKKIEQRYLTFHKKVLKNIDNLIIVDFQELIEKPLDIVKKISNEFKLSPKKVNLEKLNKNSSTKKYFKHNNDIMEECFILYKEIFEHENNRRKNNE
jgi:hypothetical protein